MRVTKNAARAAGKKVDTKVVKAKVKVAAKKMNDEMEADAKLSKRGLRRILRKTAKASAVDALKGANVAGLDIEKLSGLAARAAVAAVTALQDAVAPKGKAETQKPTPA
jgi:hypothetical protein